MPRDDDVSLSTGASIPEPPNLHVHIQGSLEQCVTETIDTNSDRLHDGKGQRQLRYRVRVKSRCWSARRAELGSRANRKQTARVQGVHIRPKWAVTLRCLDCVERKKGFVVELGRDGERCKVHYCRLRGRTIELVCLWRSAAVFADPQ